MNVEKAEKIFKKLRIVFNLWWIGLLIWFFSVGLDHNEDWVWYIFLICVVSGYLFLYYLGNLVVIFDKSSIAWVGGAFLTAPFGMIVAHFRIKAIIKNPYGT